MGGDWLGYVTCFALGLAAAHALPAALVRAHARAYRFWWRWRSRHRGGRPRLDPDLIALIRRISFENPLWGAPRIHGELLLLGYTVAQSTVSKYMIPRRGRPPQSWATFVRNHADGIAAIDMLVVRTLFFKCLYAVVVLTYGRRRILHIEVTDHPTALWLAWQMTRAFHRPPAFLIRDNDGAYGLSFRDQLRRLGIDDRPTEPASPWQNGYVERLIGSIRRECLDHMIILNAQHLRRVLRRYADHYNADRTHLALDKDSPLQRQVEPHGRVVSRSILGGLHHRYSRQPEK